MRLTLALMLFTCTAAAEIRALSAGRAASDAVLDVDSEAWRTALVVSLALHRTPPLYSTDAPATLEIPAVQIQLLRNEAATFIRLEWADKTRNASQLATATKNWVTDELVAQSMATDRFSDAVAIMIAAREIDEDVFPSLQMGDAQNPVKIFYYDMTRGPSIMEAAGRGTTKRTGQRFPVKAEHRAGRWIVTMQLPVLAGGAPISVAVWNGEQKDRDGRKYFSVWHTTE